MLQGHLAHFFFSNIFIKLNHQKAAKLHRHKKNVQYFWSRMWSWLGSDSYSKVVTGDRWVSDWPGVGIEQPVKPIAMTLIKKYFHPAWSLERESSSGWILLKASYGNTHYPISLSPPLSLPSAVCRRELRGCGRRRANMLSSLSPRPTSTRTRGCLATQSRQPFKSLFITYQKATFPEANQHFATLEKQR